MRKRARPSLDAKSRSLLSVWLLPNVKTSAGYLSANPRYALRYSAQVVGLVVGNPGVGKTAGSDGSFCFRRICGGAGIAVLILGGPSGSGMADARTSAGTAIA